MAAQIPVPQPSAAMQRGSRRRRTARWALTLVTIGLAGYLALMAWTFFVSTRAPGTVESCTHRTRHTACYGTWTVDGQRRSGKISGASSGQIGDPIQVRDGPIGAYLDTAANRWVHIAIPGVFELVLLTIIVLASETLARIRGGDARRAVAAGAWSVTASGGTARAPDGTTVAYLDGATVRGPDGRALFEVAVGGREVDVSRGGRAVARMTREVASTLWHVQSPQGPLLGSVDFGVARLFSGRGFDVLDGAGRRVGSMQGRRRLQLVLEAQVDPALAEALLAFVTCAEVLTAAGTA